MKNSILLIILLIIGSDQANGQLLRQFQDCYPTEKYDILIKEITKLDSLISKEYPSHNLKSSYAAYGKDWFENKGRLKSLYNSEVLTIIKADFDKHKIFNDSDYKNCLNKLNDKKIDVFVEMYEDKEEKENGALYVLLISLDQVEEEYIRPLDFLVLRAELLRNYLNSAL